MSASLLSVLTHGGLGVDFTTPSEHSLFSLFGGAVVSATTCDLIVLLSRTSWYTEYCLKCEN